MSLTTRSLSPVTTAGGMYPALLATPKKKKKEADPEDWVKDIYKAYKLLVKYESPLRLKLREYVQHQIEKLKDKTETQDKEYGALIVRTEEGDIELDSIQGGEGRSINLSPENVDGEILGTIHFHPVSDDFSKHDIATFLNSDWEKVSLVMGKEGTLHLAVKGEGARKIDGDIEKWERQHLDDPTDNLAKEYGFLYYKGKDLDNLKLTVGTPDTKVGSFEDLTSGIKGFKGNDKVIKKKKVNE